MRSRIIQAFISLGLGIGFVAFSLEGRLKADTGTWSQGVIQMISVSLFIGIALIILSAILFIAASSKKSS